MFDLDFESTSSSKREAVVSCKEEMNNHLEMPADGQRSIKKEPISTSWACSSSSFHAVQAFSDVTDVKTNVWYNPSHALYKEMLADVKLKLKPIVLLQRIKLPKAEPLNSGKTCKPVLSNAASLQSSHLNKSEDTQSINMTSDNENKLMRRNPAEREDVVKKLKQNLQKLKQELDMDKTQRRNLPISTQTLEAQTQPHNTIKKPRNSSTKAVNCLNMFDLSTSSDWIKVEEASDLPNRKVFYIYSGENGCQTSGTIKTERLQDLSMHINEPLGNVTDSLFITQVKQKRNLVGRSRAGARTSELQQDTGRSGRIKCRLCRKSFLNEHRLRRHLTSAHDELPNSCVMCGMQFDSRNSVKDHMVKVHRNDPIRCYKNYCPVCFKNCYSSRLLKDHLACHEKKVIGCSGCRAPFLKVKDVKKHQPCPDVAAGMPAFLCLACDEFFFKGSHLQWHINANHRGKTTIPNIYNKYYVYRQISKVEGNGPERYECKSCGKTFRFRDALKKHLPCFVKTCHVCGQCFEKETKLKMHLNLFHNDHVLECTACRKRFIWQRQLDEHQRKYQGRCQHELYVCNSCGQSVRSLSSLAKHTQKHEALSLMVARLENKTVSKTQGT